MEIPPQEFATLDELTELFRDPPLNEPWPRLVPAKCDLKQVIGPLNLHTICRSELWPTSRIRSCSGAKPFYSC
jgi:hypothetical protein